MAHNTNPPTFSQRTLAYVVDRVDPERREAVTRFVAYRFSNRREFKQHIDQVYVKDPRESGPEEPPSGPVDPPDPIF